MTAVDHAELERVAEGATTDAVKRVMAELEYREGQKIRTLGGVATADLRILVNEASGHIDALVSVLRTQAPDSWRPSLIDMARAIYDAPTRFDGDAVGTHLGRSEMVDCSARTAAEEREIVLCMCEDAASAILALRPQTAESGK